MELGKKVTFTSLAILLVFCFLGCSKKEPPTIWEKATRFVKYQSSENYLKTIDPTFQMLDQEHSPTKWVEYFFSPLSTRNWLNEDDEYAEYSREPLIPKGISITPDKRKDDINLPQLVVKADDEKSLIIVEGYDFPNEKGIIFREEWVFPVLN